MKNIYTALKLLAVGLFATAMTACSTMTNPNETQDWQGKVWRGPVTHQILDSRKPVSYGKEVDAKFKYDPSRHSGMRMSAVGFSSGWTSVIATVMVPDQIEFSQLKKGTVVDVMAEPNPQINFEAGRFTRILRIICAADDKECIKNEEKANRLRAILIDNAGDVSAQFPLTFERRITKEEWETYK
jgi:hypothetical protein